MTVVFAFLLTRVVAVIGAWIALAPTVPPSEMFRAVVTAWDGDWYQHRDGRLRLGRRPDSRPQGGLPSDNPGCPGLS